YYNRGVQHHENGALEAALADYSQAIELGELGDLSGSVYNNRGSLYENKGDFERAMADYEHAIKLGPVLPGMYLNRGNIFQKWKMYADAIEDFNKALVLDPHFVRALRQRGEARIESGDRTGGEADILRFKTIVVNTYLKHAEASEKK